MPRRRIPAGELGSVQFAQLADGRTRARVRMRDGAGELVQLRALGVTQSDALARLQARARRHTLGVDETVLTTDSTISDACDFWLGRVGTSDLAPSSIASYETIVRTIVLPPCGAVLLGTLTVGRCDRIIHGILASRSASAARRARSVLSQVCATAVRQDVLPFTRCARVLMSRS